MVQRLSLDFFSRKSVHSGRCAQKEKRPQAQED